MARKIYTVALHIFSILNYVIFLLYKETIKDKLNDLYPMRKRFGGSWKFLTHWNIVLQLIYFCLAFLNDVFGTESRAKEEPSGLQKIRDFLFATLAFPIGIFVPVIFWILFGIDRDLVFPDDLDELFPPITNHMMHTTSFPAQILELFLIYHAYPSRKFGIPAIVGFCLSYVGWIFYIGYAGGIWVYGVLEVLTDSQRFTLVVFLSLFICMLYLTGESLNSKVWNQSNVINGQSGLKQNDIKYQEIQVKSNGKYKQKKKL